MLGGQDNSTNQSDESADADSECRCKAVARNVTKTGPTMNTTSSSMASSANAVCSKEIRSAGASNAPAAR